MCTTSTFLAGVFALGGINFGLVWSKVISAFATSKVIERQVLGGVVLEFKLFKINPVGGQDAESAETQASRGFHLETLRIRDNKTIDVEENSRCTGKWKPLAA
ncbi:hypothetical protein Y032_0413g1013 [Ancylostoma ceylanicum]|uniref:Uncharacterized protein n=1 Tax=Ancylostoma ceylanicum TaxID=53326 RepID=A0A016X1H6_9BILA|nr:hypothetical protein Y032_0413g1013 [Ancylostoma ceylanicum]